MRISDWSSDVCSSDLGMGGSVRSHVGAARGRSPHRHPPSPGRSAVHVEFTEEHDSLRAMVRDFAEREIAPHAEAWDRDHHFPVDVVRAMGDLGLFGIPFPSEYGGGDGDLTMVCIAIEELEIGRAPCRERVCQYV